MKIVGIIIGLIVAYALSSWIFMLLFNLVSTYFGGPTITFWISVAIVALLSFIKNGTNNSSKSKYE